MFWLAFVLLRTARPPKNSQVELFRASLSRVLYHGPDVAVDVTDKLLGSLNKMSSERP